METMTVRQGSSDDRIDALERKVDKGFLHVEHRFESIDQRFERVDQQFEQVDKRFDKVEGDIRETRREMKAGFDRIDARLDAFQRTTILAYGGMIAGIFGVLVTQL